MATELRPFGVRCNLACTYCYQAPTRSAGHERRGYDLDAMMRTAEEIGKPFTVFGGEPLLLPLPDLERLFAFGKATFGSSSLQTNGTLITDSHVALFKTYDVRVGISVDGPGDLNALRSAHSATRTAAATKLSTDWIRQLCEMGMAPSVIITLHRANASPTRLPTLLAWISDLEKWGVAFVRLHVLESESANVRIAHGLSEEETTAALQQLLCFERTLTTLRFDLFADMRSALDPTAGGAHTCIWRGCDPYTTLAVQGVEADGSRSNCGRTNKEGLEFLKSTAPSYERSLVLYHTPQEDGGCQGCRFFLACKGQCPGTAIDGDWRNRSEHCRSWFALFETLEQETSGSGAMPLSHNSRRGDLEREMVAQWAAGTNPDPATMLRQLHQVESDATA